jgi:hypothetical protein
MDDADNHDDGGCAEANPSVCASTAEQGSSQLVFVPLYTCYEMGIETTSLGVFTSELAAIRAMIRKMCTLKVFHSNDRLAANLGIYKEKNSSKQSHDLQTTIQKKQRSRGIIEVDDYHLLEDMLLDNYLASKGDPENRFYGGDSLCGEMGSKASDAFYCAIIDMYTDGFSVTIECHPINHQADKRDETVILL